MIDTQSPGKTQAEIPYAQLEYTGSFKKPIVENLGNPTALVALILNSLEPWGFTLDGVEAKTRSEKLSEYAFVFRRTLPASPALSLTLGLNQGSGCR
jgi:hypothetical protein